ncbi:hypothetical protein EJ02DRAFT_346248 [Clathrospora elynae]|uniref:Zn(2)-C6 fungal-type domain-containing protein n=1 Tax=Clathrospora elynae TaxID=706981 RepID=A0A6A5SNB6_9PLEO|nr:hypothetical protein EJ02DRAFT_346248 [Clathrospora elynae]
MNETKKAKRQRAVLSCNDCRRRKLKCDRELPCNRCNKGGTSGSCAYESEGYALVSENPEERLTKRQRQISTQQTNPVTEGCRLSHLDIPKLSKPPEFMISDITAEDRVKQLERQVNSLEQQLVAQKRSVEKKTSGIAGFYSENEVNPPTCLRGSLKGRQYGTFFYGPTSPISIMAHFPDLRVFMKSVYHNSTAQRLAQDMKHFENRSLMLRPSYRASSFPNLRSLLPDRSTANQLVRRYLDTFETTYRIVHIPSFETAYQSYWDSDRQDDADMDALVLAILACTICTSTHNNPRYNHQGSTFHSKAIFWIKACEAWLKRQSSKHKTLGSLQVRCLRLLALSATSHKAKDYYQEIQAHMAIMKSIGMHRDPVHFGSRCSAFESEMRRRLWATSMELELQASLDKASMLSSLEHDCLSPRNINDADLHVDSEELPPSWPIDVFTESSFLFHSTQTIGLRTKLCALANSLQASLSFQEAVRYTELVQKCMKDTPNWTDARSLQVRTLLNLQLQQFLVILHAPKAVEVDTGMGSEYRYSVIALLEAATIVIGLHTDLLASSNLALCCTRNDYYRAALLVCHIAYYTGKNDDTLLAQVAKVTFDSCISKALNLQEERVLHVGRGIGAAVGLVSLQFDPSQSDALKTQAIDRVSRLLYKMLSLQEEPSEQSLTSEVNMSSASTQGSTIIGTLTEPLLAETFTNAGLHLDAFGLGNNSEWMLDDLWFLNDASTLDFDGLTHSF